jgi:hypothetical protein
MSGNGLSAIAVDTVVQSRCMPGFKRKAGGCPCKTARITSESTSAPSIPGSASRSRVLFRVAMASVNQMTSVATNAVAKLVSTSSPAASRTPIVFHPGIACQATLTIGHPLVIAAIAMTVGSAHDEATDEAGDGPLSGVARRARRASTTMTATSMQRGMLTRLSDSASARPPAWASKS